MNRFTAIGFLAKDPEVTVTPKTQTEIAKFTIAIKRSFKNADGTYGTDFYKVETYGHTARYVDKYIQKGDRIAIDGCMVNNNYVGKDGVKRYETLCKAQSVEKLNWGEKEKTEQNESSESFAAFPSPDNSFLNIPNNIEDGLPFK